MVSGNYKIAPLVCNRILCISHLNDKKWKCWYSFKYLCEISKGKEEKEGICEIGDRGAEHYDKNVQKKKNSYSIVRVFHREIFKEYLKESK